uniref:Uncharacterized protein n=1 Tax=Cannabis sativa TaxID=3483 RepID=A0A803QUQ1_CANSA
MFHWSFRHHTHPCVTQRENQTIGSGGSKSLGQFCGFKRKRGQQRSTMARSKGEQRPIMERKR